MKPRKIKGILSVEHRLFLRPFSLFLFVSAIVIILLGMFYIGANYSSDRKDPKTGREYYEQKLAEIEKELAILADPSLAETPIVDYEGREEYLLREKQLIQRYLDSGTNETQYINISTDLDDMDLLLTGAHSKGQSAARGAVNAFLVLALGFALVCFARGVWRVSSLCGGEAAQTRHLCDCSKKEMFTGSVAFDWIVLGSLLILSSVVRSIYASVGEVKWFYIENGASYIFGNIHELFFAQFLAALALGAACYFSGTAFASVASKGRALLGALLAMISVGVAATVGLIVQYVTKGEISWMFSTPLFGISFCLFGFRHYLYYIHFVLCIAIAVAFCMPTYKRYLTALPVKQNLFARVN